MLFFPKYGTYGVCAAAIADQPATIAAIRTRRDGAGKRGTRVRIGGYLRVKADLTVTPTALQTRDPGNSPPPARLLSSVRSIDHLGLTPGGDRVYSGIIEVAPGLPVVALVEDADARP